MQIGTVLNLNVLYNSIKIFQRYYLDLPLIFLQSLVLVGNDDVILRQVKKPLKCPSKKIHDPSHQNENQINARLQLKKEATSKKTTAPRNLKVQSIYKKTSKYDDAFLQIESGIQGKFLLVHYPK